MSSKILPRFRVWHRLALVLTIMLIPIAFLLYLYADAQIKQISFARSEDRGVDYLKPLHKAAQAIARHRDLTNAYLGGDQAVMPKILEAASDVDKSIAEVNQQDVISGSEFKSSEKWASIKKQWVSLKGEVHRLSQSESFTRHTQLIEDVLSLNLLVAETSNLILDPVADSYFMTSAAVLRTPQIMEDLGVMRGKSAGFAAQGMASNEEKIALLSREGAIARAIHDLKYDINSAYKSNKTLSASLDLSLQKFIAETDRFLADYNKQIIDPKRITISVDDIFTTGTNAILAGHAFSEVIWNELKEVLNARVADGWKYMLIIFGAVYMAIILALALATLMILSVTRPLGHLSQVARQVAAGDKTARAQLANTDEIGELAQQFDIMLDQQVSINEMITRENEQLNSSVVSLLQAVVKLSNKDLTVKVPVAEDVTGSVADAINLMADETAKVLNNIVAIANYVAQTTRQVRSQADSVVAVTAAEHQEIERAARELVEASDAILHIAKLAQTCNAAAEKAIQTAEQSQKTVQGTVSGINSIRETIRETEKRIKRLGERSQEIGGVVNLINSIAERTHILALNASMHAASAGEAGRGFAVVADEVQRLAENAREATSKIAALVNNIQVETSDTVTTMNEAISQVVAGTTLAEQAGAQMNDNRESTRTLVKLVGQIAQQSRNQAETTRRLSEQALAIRKSTEHTSMELQNQAVNTERLVQFSDSLMETVSVFTLPKAEAPGLDDLQSFHGITREWRVAHG